VQVGAFTVKENAEKLLAQLKADGYSGIIKKE
jgi:cell division septation protein DedD